MRHCYELGYKNQTDYEKGAIDFWERNKGIVYFSHRRKYFYKFDDKHTKMLVISSDGIIHTFMPSSISKFMHTERTDKLGRL